MARISGGILAATAWAAMFCSASGCGQKHEISGGQLQSPPVAPMVEGAEDRAGQDGGASPDSVAQPSSDAARESNASSRAKDPPRVASWPFRPTSLRLHPLTHALRTDDVVSVIEARVEFFDRFGHTTKGLGVLRFELRGTDGRRLASWEIDVADVDANMRHYDDVTRTYLFRLGLEGIADLPPSGRLDVVATTPTQKLNGSITIALR